MTNQRGKVLSFVSCFFSWLITLCCIAIVTKQTYECLEKYFEEPQNTELSVKYIGTETKVFPAITICSNPEIGIKPYNEQILNDCGIKIPEEYRTKARWTGFRTENCTNPKLLFEDIVADPEQFTYTYLSYIKYLYYDGSGSDLIRPTSKNALLIWKKVIFSQMQSNTVKIQPECSQNAV